MPTDERFTHIGKHLIDGDWVSGDNSFRNKPIEGPPDSFPVGSARHVDEAARAAERAFPGYARLPRRERAAFVRRIADEIEERAEAITHFGALETGLPHARLEGERGRTTGQLRLFAGHVEDGNYLDRRHEEALPDRTPLPRPDLRVMQQPVGPVAVFGASNFPLAFSVAGGDTASALAAGCPVIFKGHEAHPATGEVVAEAILAAIQAHSLDPGVFSFVHGGSRETGQTLVTHPLVRAVGFTGSLHGGRALLDLCVARTEPIPFYGELGSLNPMFIFPEVLAARGAAIAKGWAASLTMGVGQFCTKPGIAILTAGKSADAFADAAAEALSDVGSGVMLTDDIARGFVRGRDAISKIEKVEELASLTCEGRSVAPQLFKTTADVWLSEKTLSEEIFGPYGLIVEASDADEFVSVAEAIPGQLTCTLHLDDGDLGTAAELVGTLERKAGRLLVNGFPTGVEVGHAMVHGGPYPATTNFGHTSVGSLSIRRWLRPVCYQNFPDALLPPDLRGT